jgi:hypothetical protein
MINEVTYEDIIKSGSVERNVTSHGAYTIPPESSTVYEVKLSFITNSRNNN